MTLRRLCHLDTGAPKPRFQQHGSVAILLSDLFDYGETFALTSRVKIEVVDSMERADGIAILGTVQDDAEPIQRPVTMCVLFSHYATRCDVDDVDFQLTKDLLDKPDHRIALLCEAVILERLMEHSPIAALAFTPKVRYF